MIPGRFGMAAVVLLFGGMTAVIARGDMTSHTPTLTEADDGRTATVKTGQAVTISLPENASTGYRWAVDSIDSGMVEAAEPRVEGLAKGVGSGGRSVWTFTAKAPGQTTVALKQWRQWEGDRSIIGRFSVVLTITP